MYLPSNTFELSIAMLLFWGVTEKFPLQPHHQWIDLFFFATKKQPTYYTVSGQVLEGEANKTPPRCLEGRVLTLDLFVGIFLMAFLRGKFSAVFLFDPFFWLSPSSHLIDSLLSSLFGWNQLVKKSTHFWQLFWPSMEGDFD